MARECCELLNEVSHGLEDGLPKNGVKQDGFRPSSHQLCDIGHSFCGHRHGYAVRVL